jgi:FixJ family two-component response regulator
MRTPGAAVSTTSKPLVAVVDDDQSVRRAIWRLLRTIGMDSDPFATGEEFLQALDSMPSYRSDCVIMDVHMPGLNGLEVQQRLAGSMLPIIFITAYDEAAMRDQALAAGAVACMRKPFHDELLERTVRTALAGKRA